MKTYAWLLAMTASIGCGGNAPSVTHDLGADGSSSSACVTSGGSCVAVVPGACADGHSTGSAPCGGGIGVACCMPTAPANACETAGGTCVPVVPGYCPDGHSTGSDPCGQGIGTACCVPGPEQCTAIPAPSGSVNPATAYCVAMGYQSGANGTCILSSTVTCDEFAFYYGQCGQNAGFCELHGGTVSSVTSDMGTSTSISATCTLNGKTCREQDFAHTCTCGE